MISSLDTQLSCNVIECNRKCWKNRVREDEPVSQKEIIMKEQKIKTHTHITTKPIRFYVSFKINI